MQIASIGIDLGRQPFTLWHLDPAGQVLVRRKFSQKQLRFPLCLTALGAAALPDSKETAIALARQARWKLRLTLCPGRASLDTRVIRGFSGSNS
jgi:hypothetical protein